MDDDPDDGWGLLLARASELSQRERLHRSLPAARLRRLAQKYPPPQSWYDEDFSALRGEET